MNLHSIILSIVLLIGFYYLYGSSHEGFREGSDVFVKVDVGITATGAGLDSVNGKYAVGVGKGHINEYCKKEKKEQYCNSSIPWFYNVKNVDYEIWWGPENKWYMGKKDQDHKTAPYVNNFTGSNTKNPPQTGWLANTTEGGNPPKLSGKLTSPITQNQVTCELTLKGTEGDIEHKGQKLPTYPLYSDKGVKEGKMIRFVDDGKGSVIIKGTNNDNGIDGCQNAGMVISCKAAEGNSWNNFGSNLKNWNAEGLKGTEFNEPTIKPCLSSNSVSFMRNDVDRAPNGEAIWASSGQSDVKFEGGPNYGPFPPPAPACPATFKGFVQKILTWGKSRENGEKEVETDVGIRGIDSKNVEDIVNNDPGVLKTWPAQPALGNWGNDKILRKFVDKRGTLNLTTAMNKDHPIKVPNALRKCFDNTQSVFTGVDISPIENCINQAGFKCLKCERYYSPSKKDGTQCIVNPVDNCKTQNGTLCEACKNGYTVSSNKSKCILSPIPFCNDQNKTSCNECLSGFTLQKDKKACSRELGGCVKQKNGVCLECADRYQLNNAGAGCGPIPIEHCKNQVNIKCKVCEKGFRKSVDSYTCGITPIKHCIDQPDNPGYICNKCERGYETKGKKEKCWATAVPQCKTQEGLNCQICENGYTLRENECIETKINFCEKQEGTKCLKCMNQYELVKNKCSPVGGIRGCIKQEGAECLECEKDNTLTNGECLPTDYGMIDNCEKKLKNRCVICNQNFKLDDGRCVRIPTVPYCSTQKGSVCMKCMQGYTLRENMCFPGDLQAVVKKQPQQSDIKRCPPVPECAPGCVKGQGRCVQGLCMCNEGWSGDQCQTKLDALCPVPDSVPPRRWDLIDFDGTKISKKKFHNYNNTKTPSIPILRKMKYGLNKILKSMGPDPNDCAAQETSCPAPGSMTTEELQRWADRLREVRETKRCTPDTCKQEEKSDSKEISVTGEGKNILKVSAKEGSKEGFMGSQFSNFSTPKLSLGPRRTSNMFGYNF